MDSTHPEATARAQSSSSPVSSTGQDIHLHLHPSKIPITAVLHSPNEECQECPILQDPISTATFDILPRPFDAEHPAHTAITLCQCSHTFHAMALIYHWARSRNVQCPICRAGPPGQRLSVRKLPKEWRYSLAARLRRQKRIDRAEAEEDDRQAAMQMMAAATPALNTLQVASLFLNIRIEVLSAINIDDLDSRMPLSWVVTTTPMRLSDSIVFDVPIEELRRIPYGMGTSMRFVPRTNTVLHSLRPSRWFVAGVEHHIDTKFNVHCNETGFHHIHYSMSNAEYDEMALDIFMAYEILVAVDD